MRGWMEDEFRLALTLFSDTFTQQHAVWLPFVTQIQMWPANKGSSVLCNLEPKADVLNCRSLCLFVLNMSGFLQKAPRSFVWNNKEPEKTAQKALTFWHRRSGLFAVYGGEVNCEWLKFGRRTGEWDLVLSSSDKLQGELEEKQAVSSEEQCGIESRSADRPNPSAAGMSCAPSCMNGVDCLEFCEISFHILIMYLDYSSVYVNKFTLLQQWQKVLFPKTFCQSVACQIFAYFLWVLHKFWRLWLQSFYFIFNSHLGINPTTSRDCLI